MIESHDFIFRMSYSFPQGCMFAGAAITMITQRVTLWTLYQTSENNFYSKSSRIFFLTSQVRQNILRRFQISSRKLPKTLLWYHMAIVNDTWILNWPESKQRELHPCEFSYVALSCFVNLQTPRLKLVIHWLSGGCDNTCNLIMLRNFSRRFVKITMVVAAIKTYWNSVSVRLHLF